MELKKLTINELVAYEQACKIICVRYEKESSSYSDYIRDGFHEATKEQKVFLFYRGIYKKITDEIERRLNEIN